jgi:thioredoxin-related protein
MKKLLILSLFVGQSLCLNAQIEFEHGSFAEAKQRAAKENRLIFIDAFTVWCGPCKQLAKNIFPLPEVGEYFNKNFINVKIDMEKGEGIELAKKYTVNAYPTLLFVNAKGELVHRTCGLMPKENLLEEAQRAVLGENTFVSIQNTKNKSLGEPESALVYFKAMDDACAKFDKDVDAFFSTLAIDKIKNETIDKIVSTYVTSTSSAGFEFLNKYKTEFLQKWGIEKYNAFTKSILLNEVYAINVKTKGAEATLDKKINVYADNSDKDFLFSVLKISVAEQNNLIDNYAQAVISYVNKYALNDGNQLNNYAWSFYEKVDNAKYLQEAEKWSELASSMQKADWHVLDTYAAVLFKLKKKEQAMIEAQKAISLGKRLGDDVSETEVLLQKINQLQ